MQSILKSFCINLDATYQLEITTKQDIKMTTN